MATNWDEFTPIEPAPKQSTDWDDFTPIKEEKPQPSGIIRRAADMGIALGQGVIGVPETAVGLANLVTGGQAGKLVESAGVRFKDAKDILGEYYSPEQKASNQAVAQADGFIPTLKAVYDNPSTIVKGLAENVPGMLLGGAIGRGVHLATKAGPILAGAIGEGVVSAGQNAEQARQESPTGTLTPEQSAILAASGVATGGINLLSGKLANKLGIADIETMLAAGKLGAVGQEAVEAAAKKGVIRKAAEGFINEGVLQELPQSFQEQVAQNLATGKPWDEGAGNAAAMGLVIGGLMGGGGNVISHFGDKVAPPADAPPPGSPPPEPTADFEPAPVKPGEIAPAPMSTDIPADPVVPAADAAPASPVASVDNPPVVPPAPPTDPGVNLPVEPATPGSLTSAAQVAVATGAATQVQSAAIPQPDPEQEAAAQAKAEMDSQKSSLEQAQVEAKRIANLQSLNKTLTTRIAQEQDELAQAQERGDTNTAQKRTESLGKLTERAERIRQEIDTAVERQAALAAPPAADPAGQPSASPGATAELQQNFAEVAGPEAAPASTAPAAPAASQTPAAPAPQDTARITSLRAQEESLYERLTLDQQEIKRARAEGDQATLIERTQTFGAALDELSRVQQEIANASVGPRESAPLPRQDVESPVQPAGRGELGASPAGEVRDTRGTGEVQVPPVGRPEDPLDRGQAVADLPEGGRSAPSVDPTVAAARELVSAVDAGGIPLNPAVVNRVASDLGLEVSRRSAPEQTIERIREAVARADERAAMESTAPAGSMSLRQALAPATDFGAPATGLSTQSSESATPTGDPAVADSPTSSAQAFVSSVESGVTPTPAQANRVARTLGLDVSTQTDPQQTVAMIREAVASGQTAPVSPLIAGNVAGENTSPGRVRISAKNEQVASSGIINPATQRAAPVLRAAPPIPAAIGETAAKMEPDLTNLFRGLEGRGMVAKRAVEAVKANPMAARVEYVEQNFLDLLEHLEGAGKVRINC